MPYDPYDQYADDPTINLDRYRNNPMLNRLFRGRLGSFWDNLDEMQRARRGRAAAEREYLNNPLARLRKVYGADFDELINPGGNQRLYRALYEQGIMGGAARQRRALTGLRARGGAPLGSYGVAALMSDLDSSSELAQTLSGARERSIGETAAFRRQLAEEQLRREQELFTQQKGYEYQSRLSKQAHEQELERQRKNRRKRVGIGPVGFSW